MEKLVIAGGIYCIGLVVFHLLFWKIFHWPEGLRALSSVNRGIMQVLNLSLTFVFLIFAYISLFHTQELVHTSLGNSLLWLIGGLWIWRAMQQGMFFGLKHWISWVFLFFFLLGAGLYLVPAIQTIS